MANPTTLSASTNEFEIESDQDELVLTSNENEQIESVTNRCNQILEELKSLHVEQQEEVNKEKEELNLIQEEIDEAASTKSFILLHLFADTLRSMKRKFGTAVVDVHLYC